MLRSLRVPTFLGLLGVLTVPVLGIWGCPSLPLETCGEIPPDGCPVQSGGTCADPTCAALYTCENEIGTWVSVQACPQHGTGGGGSGGGGAGGGPMLDAGPCTPPAIDMGPDAGISQDCTVDLEAPDCPIAAAEPCAQEACLTGCSDFFICSGNVAPGCPVPPCWVDVAYCDDNGNFIVTQ
jgi:hypothetical protein